MTDTLASALSSCTMIAKTLRMVALAAAFCVSSISFADDVEQRPVWPHIGTDIQPDPALYFGLLPNGLRYVVLPHDEPPGRASLRLYVNAGSLMESEKEQGLAHFLEHMAFNGSENHEPGSMVEYFQRIGMGFGNDTNAHTSWLETVYLMEAPSVGEDMLNDTMQMLRDYAGGLLLLQNEVDRERGVILAEKRERDTVRFRMFEDGFKFTLPESLVPQRFPIGTEDCIKAFNSEDFRSFYSRWYTPDRMLVVVVGDIDVERGKALVERHFADLPANEKPLPNPDLGRIDAERGTVARVYREPEAPEVSVNISMVRPLEVKPDSKAERVESIKRAAANAIINRRLSILSKEEGAPISEGSTYSFQWLDFLDSSEIDVSCRPETWQEALAVAEQQLRKALKYGFTQAELDEIRANMMNGYEQAVKSAPTKKSAQLADELYNSFADGRVYTSAEQDLVFANEVLPALTVEGVLKALREAWNGRNRIIYVSGNLPEGASDEDALAAFRESRKVEVEVPLEQEAVQFAYRSFGAAGKVLSAKLVEDLGVTQLRMTNNVFVNLMPTDFEKNVVRVNVRIGSGMLEAPTDKPGLPIFASMVYSAGGLEAHSADEIKRIFAGKTVGAGFAVTPDSFQISGTASTQDLSDELDLITAYIVAPGYREEAQRQVAKAIPMIYTQLKHTPDGLMQDAVDRFLHGGSPLFGFPEMEVFMKRNMGELREWLFEPMSRGRMEVTIVGDFQVDDVVPMLERTFGALPQRNPVKPEYAERRVLPVVEAQTKVFEYQTAIPKAVSMYVWPTEDMWDIYRTRRLSVLADIITDRLRLQLREKLGEAYSPYAYNHSSDTFKGLGFLACVSNVAPDKLDEVAALVRTIGEDIVRDGVTQDELDRALKPTMEQISEWRRNNRYWLGSVLASSQEFPLRLTWARNMVDDFSRVSVEDINALAREYLKPERAIDVRVVPVAQEADASQAVQE